MVDAVYGLDDGIDVVAQNQEVDKVHNQLSEDDGKLVPRHQRTTYVAGCYFGDVHGADGRCQTYTYTTQYAVEVEGDEQRIGGLTVFKEEELGVVRTEGRQEEEYSGDEKRFFTTECRGEKSREGTAYNTAYEGA